MSETRKIAAILVADVVGYSRLAGADEERTLARMRALRRDLIDPIISVHHGRIVKRTGDGSIIEFRSVVDAVRCAIEVQDGMVERNAGLPSERRIEFRAAIHLGDVVEEADGDLMGDGVNVAARLEGIAEPGGLVLSEDASRHVRDKVKETFVAIGPQSLRNIVEPVRVYSLELGRPAEAKPPSAAAATVKPKSGKPAPTASFWSPRSPALSGVAALLLLAAAGGWRMLGERLTKSAQAAHLSVIVLPFANLSGDPSQDYLADGVTENLTTELSRINGSFVIARNTAFTYKDRNVDAKEIGRELQVRYVLEGSGRSSRCREGRSYRRASSALAAGQRHDLVRREPACRRASHPLEAARLDRVFANAAQIGATVLGDSKIDLAARLDAKAVTNRLRDRHLTLARHCHRHFADW